jgi:hypothetical protein
MQNHGLREGSEQEEWQRLGPLAQPTPANTKNRGATNRRGRRRDEERGTDRNGEGRRDAEEQECGREQRGEGDNENVGTQELGEAMAEAIYMGDRERGARDGRQKKWGAKEGTDRGDKTGTPGTRHSRGGRRSASKGSGHSGEAARRPE